MVENIICNNFTSTKQKYNEYEKDNYFIRLGLLLVMNYTAFAEQRGIFMDFHGDINPKKDMEVNRTPMKLPIEVIYDSDVHTIEVIGNGSLEAEVFLYNINGTLESYSPILNTDFTVLNLGTYSIQIQGDGWYAEGEVEIE